jgi:hypothetical protein
MARAQTVEWRKSSFSAANNNCVEVAELAHGGVALRHSNNHDKILEFSAGEWKAFRDGVAAGEWR